MPAASARVLIAAVLVLAGLVAPQVDPVLVHAAPSAATAASAVDDAPLVSSLRADLENYLQARGEAEHVSAAALSVSLADRGSSIDVSAGTMTFGGSEPVPSDSMWQIGSNTKAFTAVLLLQLEAEGRLSIDDPLGRWLSEYPQWADVPIRRLLNMTSGIPDYDEQPAFQADYAADPQTEFTPERLVGYAVGAPATSGWSYSNTNYVLAEMIIGRAAGLSYECNLHDRIIEPDNPLPEQVNLPGTYYTPHTPVIRRQPAGYFFDDRVPAMSALLGTDVSRDTLSWARGAGGIYSTTSDLTRWERQLYTGRLLPAQQQAELTGLVSTQTGEPIEQTSPADPRGFGLGVAQATSEKFGTFWFYEGRTLGFRTLHVYLPESGLIMVIGLNSAPVEDRILALAESVYDTLASRGVVPA